MARHPLYARLRRRAGVQRRRGALHPDARGGVHLSAPLRNHRGGQRGDRDLHQALQQQLASPAPRVHDPGPGSREAQPKGGLMFKPSTCPENRNRYTPTYSSWLKPSRDLVQHHHPESHPPRLLLLRHAAQGEDPPLHRPLQPRRPALPVGPPPQIPSFTRSREYAWLFLGHDTRGEGRAELVARPLSLGYLDHFPPPVARSTGIVCRYSCRPSHDLSNTVVIDAAAASVQDFGPPLQRRPTLLRVLIVSLQSCRLLLGLRRNPRVSMPRWLLLLRRNLRN